MNKERIDTYASRLSTALAMRKMRQVDLCDKLNLPTSTMCQYMKGITEPRHKRLCEIAEALNVSEAWLMGYDVPMETQEQSLSQNKTALTECERKLLDVFRLMPDEQQKMFLEMGMVFVKGQNNH